LKSFVEALPVPVPASAQARTSVLFIIHGLGRAGPELRLLDFAQRFPGSTGVHVCSIGESLALLEEFKKTRASVSVVPIRRAYADWRSLARITASIREHDIVVVNSFGLKTLLVCLTAKLRFGRRIRAVHHVVSLWEELRWYQRALMRRAMERMDVIVCNGQALKDVIIGTRAVAPRVTVIPNGVDCEHFRSTPALRLAERERQGYGPEHFVLGTVGNIRPVKNYPFLLRAMQRIHAAHPHTRLLCVGGGQVGDMQRLARSLGLGEVVRFTGLAADVRPHLAAMDAFALCSLKEGSPNAVLQAMAMSLPTIASSVGEIPYLLDHGAAGLLIDPTDEDALVAGVSRFLDDAAYRRSIAEAGRHRAESTYSIERMIDTYHGLFDELAVEARAERARGR
jgi:glycosyltransferase involved in cell wall biosynthesis